jgi:hypothetical protein
MSRQGIGAAGGPTVRGDADRAMARLFQARSGLRVASVVR